jgi:putative addiction module killer protein
MKYELEQTEVFESWLSSLKDRTLRRRILVRLARVQEGNFGDCKAIAANLHELRCFFGGGLRLYYTLRGKTLVLLLTGGDKSTQAADIAEAQALIAGLPEHDEVN